MKYLIVSTDIARLAVPLRDPAQAGVLVAALSEARVVERSYRADKYMPKEVEIELSFVDGSKVTIGDELETLRAQLADEKAEREQRDRWWSEERKKSQKLSEELAALKSGKPAAATEKSEEIEL